MEQAIENPEHRDIQGSTDVAAATAGAVSAGSLLRPSLLLL